MALNILLGPLVSNQILKVCINFTITDILPFVFVKKILTIHHKNGKIDDT